MAKRKQARRHAEEQADPADGGAPASPSSSPPPSPGGRRLRGWLARIGLAIGIPVLLLLAVEGVLRVTGFGYDPHFFAHTEGTRWVGSNAEFGRTYFPAEIARKPVENLFRDPKPAGVYRIVLLGSSAAIGVPDAQFNFARILGVMLEQTYPGIRFQVIVAGITATNSHVLLPIAREAARYEPDLFLVYVGNNEVIGPFGIQADENGGAPGLGAIRSSIALRRTKLGQLVQTIGASVAGQDVEDGNWRGMEAYLDHHVRHDDSRLDRIAANYEQNLRDICGVGLDAGASVVVCTVASNLADSPPFGSRHRPDLDEAAQQQWEEAYRAGEALLQEGDVEQALQAFRYAETIDGTYAALQFRIGQCHERLQQAAPALKAFQLARDLDTLRFRTDDRLNDLARGVVAGVGSPRVLLADCQRALETGVREVDDIPGKELFFEHVHMTFLGNHAIARAIFPVVAGALPPAIAQRGPERPRPPTPEACAAALAYTPWNEYRMIEQVVRLMLPHPPFTGQIDHRQTMGYWQGELAALREESSGEQARRIGEAYVAAARARPDDVLLQLGYARLLQESGNTPAAEDLLRRLLERLPAKSPLATAGLVEATM
jgi:tetratricopeptide (TPR) repeat protein